MLFDRPKPPEVLSARTLGIALAIHLGFFACLWVFAAFHGLFDKEETVVPIDLTVVVVENLDGNEDEPPPLKKPEPPPPPPPKPKAAPKPKPKEPEKPKELEKIVTNIVEKVEKKPDKKPAPPKKSKKELMEERIKKMRDSAKDVKRRPVQEARPQPNGRTDRKVLSDAEIQKLLMAGYKPGRTTNLAANEEQLCVSLIRQAFEAKWDKPPWTDTLKPMVLTCQFGNGGRLIGYKLTQSSGDPKADQTILSAAKRVGVVRGLTPDFIDKYRGGVPVRFTVRPQ